MYVYILVSKIDSSKTYVGVTKNFKRRLSEHNSGNCKSTCYYRPWKPRSIHWIEDKKKAYDLERYFKTASGIAFRNKRL